MRALKRRLNHKNPNVQLLALGVRTKRSRAVQVLTWVYVARRYMREEWRRPFPC